MPSDDRARGIFDRALSAGLSSPEIVDAADEAGIPLEELSNELRDDAPSLWAAVEDEEQAFDRAEATLARQYRDLEVAEGELSWTEIISFFVGLSATVGSVLAALAGALLYLVSDVVGNATTFLSWRIGGWLSAAFAAGMLGFFISDRAERRRKRPTAEMREAQDALDAQLTSAAEVVETALLEQAILPRLRESIDRRFQDSFALRLSIESSVGLAEPFDPRFEIPTPARAELERILATRSGANVGLAGPRGVGKTTLIASVARAAEEDRICVRAAAPVQYEPREFLLHLFALLCESVLEREGVQRTAVPSIAAMPESSALRRARRLALRLAEAFGLASTLSAPSPRPSLSPLARQALDLLDHIRFQQTHTQGWSGTLQAPVASAQVEGSRSYMREPMTFPDVVAGFRAFAAQLGAGAKVVIGIDELDKMENEERAERFVNDIKAIFDVRNCFYLLSVSEDALSRFERRGVPVRDAFDSSLDEIVLVTPLDLAGAMALVRRRVIGMPVPFVALAHCLSGGIPRELLRVVRRMVAVAEQVATAPSLATVAEALLRDDLLRKIAATTSAHQERGPDRAAALFAWASELKAADAPASLRGILGEIATDPHADAGLSAYAYFLHTLLELFDDRLDEVRLREAIQATDARGLERLAEARQAFTFGPDAPRTVLTAFRRAHDFPLLMHATA
jgi:hypothetical protein